MSSMVRACIALGSNLDNPVLQITQALEALSKLPYSNLVKASSLYTSAPQGPQDQGRFINAVALIETRLQPEDLLKNLQAIEKAMGRIKTRHWGERCIDLDIIFYGQLQIAMDDPDLKIPHPLALSRDFVMIPLLEIVPDWTLPNGDAAAERCQDCLQHDLTKLP